MTILIADIAMSLDGFVADTKDDPSELFGWYFGGDVAVPTPQPGFSFMAPEPSARVLRDGIATIGALIGGRRYFDLADGWGGNHRWESRRSSSPTRRPTAGPTSTPTSAS